METCTFQIAVASFRKTSSCGLSRDDHDELTLHAGPLGNYGLAMLALTTCLGLAIQVL